MWEGFTSYNILFLSNWPFCITKRVFFLIKVWCKIWKICLIWFLKNISQHFKKYVIYCLNLKTLPPTVTEWNQNISPPSPPTVQSQAPLLTCGSCWTAAHGINSSWYSWQPYSNPPHTVVYFTAGLNSFFTGILERIKNFTIPKSFI